jgi:hypothetical protein
VSVREVLDGGGRDGNDAPIRRVSHEMANGSLLCLCLSGDWYSRTDRDCVCDEMLLGLGCEDHKSVWYERVRGLTLGCSGYWDRQRFGLATSCTVAL